MAGDRSQRTADRLYRAGRLMHALLKWLETSAVGTAVAQSAWLFPAVETIHVIALTLVVGSIAIIDLRLLHRSWRGRAGDGNRARYSALDLGKFCDCGDVGIPDVHLRRNQICGRHPIPAQDGAGPVGRGQYACFFIVSHIAASPPGTPVPHLWRPKSRADCRCSSGSAS